MYPSKGGNVVFATWLQTPGANTLFLSGKATAALFHSFQADAGKTYIWAMGHNICSSFS